MSLHRVLVYGGRGALGSACVKTFKSNGWWVGSVDLHENEEADACIVVDSNLSWVEQEVNISERVKSLIGEDKLDAILCVAGGWAGGNAVSPDFIKNANLMWQQSVWSSSIAASLAAKFLSKTGLITLPGADPALNGTPGMIGYGMAKAAVHHLVKSLGKPESGLPVKSTALGILPVTLDTPSNRKWMPNADTTSWTPLEFISELLFRWASDPETRPPTGTLISLKTHNSETSALFN